MRIVFMGSAELAVPSLRAILDRADDEVVGVISQPDRPAGRKRQLTPSPLKAFAQSQQLNIHTPEKVGDPETLHTLEQLRPDLIVVVAYGQYIPSTVIRLARYEAINVHPSLLPKYRGAAPIQWAIANGDTHTGISIIYVAKEMDAGDVILQRELDIDPDDTSGSLSEKVAEMSGELLIAAMNDLQDGSAEPQPQDPELVIEVRKLEKEDGRIDWTLPAL